MIEAKGRARKDFIFIAQKWKANVQLSSKRLTKKLVPSFIKNSVTKTQMENYLSKRKKERYLCAKYLKG